MKTDPANPMGRREFLKSTIAGAVVLSTVNTHLQAAEPGPRLRAGFLGTAHSHFRGKLPVIRESGDWELIGLAEEDESIRARGPKDVRWLSSEQLCAEADVVIVESAVKDHARHAKQALRAGKHVHVEKPPAVTMEEFREMMDLARERECILQVGYMWRYNPGIRAVIEAARQGWLGEVYLVRATMNTLVGADERREWGRFRGGAMFEQGCHLIDALVRLLGRPLRVQPFLKQTGQDGLADNCVSVFEFPKALGIITSAPLQPNAGPQRFFEVLGTNGTARVQPLEQPALIVDLAKAAGPYGAGRQEIAMPPYRRYVDEFVALAAAIRSKEPLPFNAGLEANVQEAVLRACDMF